VRLWLLYLGRTTTAPNKGKQPTRNEQVFNHRRPQRAADCNIKYQGSNYVNTSKTEITETAVGQPMYFDKCDDIVPRAQMCNSIRFTQMLLLKSVKLKTAPGPTTKKRDIIPGGFLILQPRAVSLGSMEPSTEEAIQRRVARFRQKIERSMPITSDIAAGRLPDPGQGHKAVNEMRTALLARGGVW
jgi:hypothetical protein